MRINLAGFKIGHKTDATYPTGCTVILCPPNTVGSAEVRGLGPASREMALMAPDKHVEYVNAVSLSGGSAFGLAAADGVMRYLAEQKIGYWTPIRPIPIVPAASLFDLFLTGGQKTPDADMGYAACLNLSEVDIPQGNVGAGAGATVGKWSDPQSVMKAGFGLTGVEHGELVVVAATAVNAIGDVVNEDGSVLAGARGENDGWAAETNPFRQYLGPPRQSMTNTTLAVVMTNAKLNKVEAFRLAQRAHDGLAIAIRPAHTPHDGDTTFALASGMIEAPFDLVANTAVSVVAEAIRNSVRFAASVGIVKGLGDE